MKDKKTEFRWFTIMDYEKEATYLREQRKLGWKFINIGFIGFYHFEKCTPEDVVYQLDYNEEGSQNKDEYIQMFKDCGWEYLLEYAGYSYFCKPASKMNGNEEIFCDDDSRLDMMKRVFKGRILPIIIILCGIVIPQLFFHSTKEYLHSLFTYIFSGLFVLYVIILVQFAFKYINFLKKLGK